jgi:hypothetical protein
MRLIEKTRKVSDIAKLLPPIPSSWFLKKQGHWVRSISYKITIINGRVNGGNDVLEP